MIATSLIQALAQLALAALPLAPAGPPRVAVEDLLAEPTDALGTVVSSYIQFQSEIEEWNPLLTRFGQASYRAFRCWGDEQLLWQQEAYEAPAILLFVARGSRAERHLARAACHDRLVVNLVPREYVGGRLWVEVVQAIPCRRHVPEGAVMHAIRAHELIAREAWTMAHGELERALSAPLPEHVREALKQVQASCAGHHRDEEPALPMEAPVVRKRTIRARDARDG